MVSASSLTVFGSFGFGNLGDELVPDCFGHLLAAAGQASQVRSMSRFSKIPPGVSAAFPEPDAALPQDLAGQTLVLSGA